MFFEGLRFTIERALVVANLVRILCIESPDYGTIAESLRADVEGILTI